MVPICPRLPPSLISSFQKIVEQEKVQHWSKKQKRSNHIHTHTLKTLHSSKKKTMAKCLTDLFYIVLVFCCLSNTPPAYCLANETDRLALIQFKAAIDQDPLGALSSWNDSVHYCNWKGIVCGRRHPDRVIELKLMSLGLVGTLTPHVGNLSFLRSRDCYSK